MTCRMLRFFSTFGVFGEIVRIRVEYRMLRGTQERDVRMYEPALITRNYKKDQITNVKTYTRKHDYGYCHASNLKVARPRNDGGC